ncbi:MAG: D-alanyl-D-alanine carboxypeptidase, partial [Ginsengibacter sp.]
MNTTYLLIALISISLLTSCSASRKLKKEVTSALMNTPTFKNAQTGISIYEPATGKFWLNYQGDKYFVPASNTKLVTCYAAMKYLGDSLAGLYYTETDNNVFIRGTGDPTFLHADFPSGNVLNFLTSAKKILFIDTSAFHESKWGPGWSWDDYSDYYMVDKTDFPVYGNILTLSGTLNNLKSIPAYFRKSVSVSDSLNTFLYPGNVRRDIDANIFKVTETNSTVHYTETP